MKQEEFLWLQKRDVHTLNFSTGAIITTNTW